MTTQATTTQVRYSITKFFVDGLLAGITITEVMPFPMSLGYHKSCTGSNYTITDCREVTQ